MSYLSRVYRQRNPHTQDEKQQQPFFSHRQDASGSKKNKAFFQAKLSVNQPGDSHEKEADAVAHSVVNKTSAVPLVQQKKIGAVQRLATTPEEEKVSTNDMRMERDKGKPFQRKAIEPEKEKPDKIHKKEAPTSTTGTAASPTAASPSVTSRMESSSGKGKPLPAKTMREMSASFGADFRRVRIHDDNDSAEMSQELQAQAFTHGNDIYFDKGKYHLESAQGKFLLAHELTHVIQQQGVGESGTYAPAQRRERSVQRTIGDLHDLSSPRFKGDPDLEACFDGEETISKRSHNRGEFVKKIQQALIDAGFPLPKFGVDGIFGDETAAAIKAFQKQSGLALSEQDGDIGPITMSRLDSRFTGGSATTTEQTCQTGNKQVKVDFVMMSGATGNPITDLAFANQVFKDCCIEFVMGSQITMPTLLSDALLGGDTDLDMAGCNAVSSEDLITFLTATSLFGLTNRIIAFYVDILHDPSGRLQGDSVSPLCGTGPRAPMVGMVAIANGAGARTFPHEIAHVLMNTFADHRVTADNLQHVSGGSTGQKIAPVQCAIMYTRV